MVPAHWAGTAMTPPVRLSLRIDDPEAIPDFLWDEPRTVRELRELLATAQPAERARLEGKILREARFDEAIALVSLRRILEDWDGIRRHLGRRLPFWEYLIGEWRSLGLVP